MELQLATYCHQVYNQSMMDTIQLPHGLVHGELSVEEAIATRRSERDFSRQPMSLDELSHVLHYSSGITERRYRLRAAPSAGATYPIEIYPVVNNVEGLARGIYHYVILSHELEKLREGDFRQEMAQASLRQSMVSEANVALVLSAVFQRTRRRYRERAQRYIVLETGHIAQNIYLVATSLGLGSCAIGAFHDEDFNLLLGLDGKEESVIYIMVVGKIRKEQALV